MIGGVRSMGMKEFIFGGVIDDYEVCEAIADDASGHLEIIINNKDIIERLLYLGVLKGKGDSIRDHNIGESDYSKHIIQPWSIWLDYNLNPWDADIIKRVLRDKKTDSRTLDYEKIKHICDERIRQIKEKEKK